MAGLIGKIKFHAWSVAAITLAGMAAYAPTLNNALVCDDYYVVGIDRLHLFGYERLGNLSTLKWIFYAEFPVQVRPIPLASFRFLSHFFGLTPWPYHLLGVLLHIGCACLLYFLITSLGISRLAALMAGALFVLTPIAPETVTWPAGIIDTYALFFILLALCLYVRFLKIRSGAAYFGALVCMGAALLSKEVAIPLLVMLPLADLLFAGSLMPARGIRVEGGADGVKFKKWFDRYLARLLPVLALFSLYLLMRYYILGVIAGANSQMFKSAGSAMSWGGLYDSFVTLVAPLNALYVASWARWLFFALQAILFTIALLLVAYRYRTASRVANRTMLLFSAMFVAPLIPVAGTLLGGVKSDLQWSHFLYVSMAAFLAIMSIAIFHYGRSSKVRLAVALPAVLTLLLFSAWGLIQNNRMWEDVSQIEGSILNQIVDLVPDPPSGANIYIAEESAREGERLYWCTPMLQPAIRSTYQKYDIQVKQLPLQEAIANTSGGYMLIVDGLNGRVKLGRQPGPSLKNTD